MKTAFKLSILVISLLHLFKPLIPFDIGMLLFFAAAAALVTGTNLMSGIFKYATLVFLACGIFLLAYSGQKLDAWSASFGSMTNIIAIIVIMQLFALPLTLGGYQESILLWVRKKFNRQGSLFLFTTVLEHILTSFLSFGAVPIIITLLENTLKKSVDRFDRFTATATSRGYALTAIWAPGAINVFLVLEATGIEWSALFIPGLILSAIGIALSMAVEIGGKKVGGYLASREDNSAFDKKAAVASACGLRKPASGSHILFVAGAFLLTVFLMEKAAFGAVYNRIIFSGILVSLGWTAVLAFGGRVCSGASLREIGKDHWKNGLLKAGDLAPFFIAIGAFSGSLEHSGFIEAIKPSLAYAAVVLGPAALVAVPILIVLLGMIGIHPFITIVLFGKILGSVDVHMPAVTVALLLSSSGVVSYMLSPFTGIIMTIAKFTGTTAYNVAIRWNWLYCLLFAVTSIVFAFCWGWLFGT